MSPQGFTVSEEKTAMTLSLIVDKHNVFGGALCEKTKDIKTVLVTEQAYPSSQNILAVQYKQKIPEIPEGKYTHMFFVWDGKEETIAILEPLLKKASLDKARFVFVTEYHFYTDKLLSYIQQFYPQAVMILIGDVFGKASYGSCVTTFFEEAHTKGLVTLGSVGLRTIYPVFYEDVLEQLIYSGYGTTQKGVLFACMQYGMTELSLIHVLQQVDPMIKVDFSKEEKPEATLPHGEYLFSSQYDVVRKLQDTYVAYAASRKGEKYHIPQEPSYSPQTVLREKNVEKKRKRKWGAMVLFVLILLFSPLLMTGAYAALGAGMLYAAVQSAQQGSLASASRFAKTGDSLFALSQTAGGIGASELQLLFLSRVGERLIATLHTGRDVAQLLSDGLQAAVLLKDPANATAFSSGVNNLKDAFLTLQEIPPTFSYHGVTMGFLQQLISPYSGLVDVAPELLGFPIKKTYLVLLQNNMELRPGGGFIGSYALVTVNQGKVKHVTIHNVYDADGQLKGHVEPPSVLRRYMQPNWFLRDSNFDVDFAQDAANAAFFLKQETGQTVDGVIGVDLSFVKALLALTGPVYVPSYNQTVTTNNFFLLTETHAEKNSFAGSTQKQDFLRAVFLALQAKMRTSHPTSFSALLPLLASVREKHILFGFADTTLQNAFSVNGFSSTLWDGRKATPNTILDFTGINEANLGVNKANYFVKRTESQAMTIDPSGSISGTLTIDYKNSSKPNVWPGGAYKIFLRVIIPQGAQLLGISINGQHQSLVPAVTDAKTYEAKGFVAPQGLEVYANTEEGKQLYGFFVTVPEEQHVQVTVSYTLSQTVDLTQPTFSYEGLLFKQPGTDSYPYSFSLAYPSGYGVLSVPTGMHDTGSTISFTKNFSQDIPFTLEFSKK